MKSVADPDPYQIENQNPDPHQSENQDPDPYQSEKQDPDPYQKGLDPQHWNLSHGLKTPFYDSEDYPNISPANFPAEALYETLI
jgi:hypothetical protein